MGKNFFITPIWKQHSKLRTDQERNPEALEIHCVLEMTPTVFHLEDALLQTSVVSGFTNTDVSTGKYESLERQTASDFSF